MSSQIKSALAILRRKQVEAKTGLSRSSIYDFMSKGKFPRPITLGARAVGWLEADVEQWLAGCIAASRKAAGVA
jgi:prophage regulatory protein